MPGDLLINPANVDLGRQTEGAISEGKTIIIQSFSDVSTGALDVKCGPPGTDEIFVTANTCAAPLAPRASCALTIHFVGPYSGLAMVREVIVTDGETDRTIKFTAFTE